MDIGIFAGGVYVMYKFGPQLSETIDSYMPTEEGIQKAMQEMQGQMGGGMPPQMWVYR